MGRYGKEYKRVQIKLTKWIYEDLEHFKEVHNSKYGTRFNRTQLIEQAIIELLQNHADVLEDD